MDCYTLERCKYMHIMQNSAYRFLGITSQPLINQIRRSPPMMQGDTTIPKKRGRKPKNLTNNDPEEYEVEQIQAMRVNPVSIIALVNKYLYHLCIGWDCSISDQMAWIFGKAEHLAIPIRS